MAGVNKVILVGNLGKDPEVRRTQDGRPVVSFSIATNETWTDKASGERKDRVEWHNVVIFNEGLCKVAEQYLKKGSKVYIEGAQKTRKWTDKDKIDRWTTETVLSNFNASLVLLDRKDGSPPAADDEQSYGSNGSPPGGSSSAGGAGMATGANGGAKRGDMDDEIPF